MAANGGVSSRNKSNQSYMEIIEQASNYNRRLCIEKRLRLPFLDSQTGVAQNHCYLWMNWRMRCKGNSPAQLYTYPAKRWRKKKRAFPIEEIKIAKVNEIDTSEAGICSSRYPQIRLTRHTFDMHQITAVENPALRKDEEEKETVAVETTKDWYDELEDISEPPDAGEIDERGYDSSDFEIETYRKKKKKTPSRRGRKKEDKEYDDREKPYSCDVCGARYKSRPGLNYHLRHAHNGPLDDDSSVPSPSIATPTQTGRRSTRQSGPPPPAADPVVDDKASPNLYCDFCLGDQLENKKTGQKEELVSCADCGRSGHPSCLQFTDNMIISVKKYPWQCIECKSCGLCGTSDNDDQLLFCDDCDRGYHMYCLDPPLSEPPEGNWSCHLCIQEFHGGKKPEGMQ